MIPTLTFVTTFASFGTSSSLALILGTALVLVVLLRGHLVIVNS